LASIYFFAYTDTQIRNTWRGDINNELVIWSLFIASIIVIPQDVELEIEFKKILGIFLLGGVGVVLLINYLKNILTTSVNT